MSENPVKKLTIKGRFNHHSQQDWRITAYKMFSDCQLQITSFIKIFLLVFKKMVKGENKKAQVSIEYIVIVGFASFIIIGILGVAYYYSGSIKDKLKMNQVEDFGNKIISASESVFYSGEPSKATFFAYLPEGVSEISISENSLFISIQLSSGITKTSFKSNVPIEGSLTEVSGLKKIRVLAGIDKVAISQV